MKRINIHSLRFRLLAYIAAIFIVFLGLVLINNSIAIRELQSKIYQVTKENLTTYQNRLNDSFVMTENYLINFSFDNSNIMVIDANRRNTTQWYSSLYQVQKSFTSATSIYDMDGFFLYSPPGNTYIASVQSGISNTVTKKIKTAICPFIDNGDVFANENKGQWFPLKIEEDYYLFRIIKVHNSYLGAWISTTNALYPLVGDELAPYIFITDNLGNILSKTSQIDTLTLPEDIATNRYQTIEIDHQKNLVVSSSIDSGNIQIVALIPHKQFYMDINKYVPFMITAVLIVIGLMITAFFIINRLVIHPLTHLNLAIASLKSGKLDTQVTTSDTCTEFTDVNNAFNEMVGEIRTLKIDVYEEKLSKQRINTQYLKIQIAPHFLINCLSTAYQLAELNRPDLTKAMLRDLSHHLRYTLSAGNSVSLSQEMMHVKNYIELSKIRYPNGIVLFEDCQIDTMNASVISLLIHNFVENTIKYEVVLGNTIAIHISTALIKKGEVDFLSITIWDTGSGFDDVILRQLQDVDQYVEDMYDRHIGISNVFQRAVLFYGRENCHFSFTNRPKAGAQIDIEIPFNPYSASTDMD